LTLPQFFRMVGIPQTLFVGQLGGCRHPRGAAPAGGAFGRKKKTHINWYLLVPQLYHHRESRLILHCCHEKKIQGHFFSATAAKNPALLDEFLTIIF